MIDTGAARSSERRDYVLRATTAQLRRRYEQRAANARMRLAQLRNKDGGYARDLADLVELYETIVRTCDIFSARARSATPMPMLRAPDVGECEPIDGMICRRYYKGTSACTRYGGQARCLEDERTK